MKESKNKIKTLGIVLHVIALIARICLYVATVVLLLVAITIPAIFSKVDISKDSIRINATDNKIELYKDKEGKLKLSADNKDVYLSEELNSTEFAGVEALFNMVNNTNTSSIVAFIEAIIIFSIVTIILAIIIVKNLDNFCKSLYEKEELFTEDKSKWLIQAGKFMIISYVVSLVISLAISKAIGSDYSLNYNVIGIVEILVVYLAAYIFSYASGLDAKKVEVIPQVNEKIATPKKTTTVKKAATKKTATSKKTTTKTTKPRTTKKKTEEK